MELFCCLGNGKQPAVCIITCTAWHNNCFPFTVNFFRKHQKMRARYFVVFRETGESIAIPGWWVLPPFRSTTRSVLELHTARHPLTWSGKRTSKYLTAPEAYPHRIPRTDRFPGIPGTLPCASCMDFPIKQDGGNIYRCDIPLAISVWWKCSKLNESRCPYNESGILIGAQHWDGSKIHWNEPFSALTCESV